jgi:hypothetical protein
MVILLFFVWMSLFGFRPATPGLWAVPPGTGPTLPVGALPIGPSNAVRMPGMTMPIDPPGLVGVVGHSPDPTAVDDQRGSPSGRRRVQRRHRAAASVTAAMQETMTSIPSMLNAPTCKTRTI